MAPGIAHLRDGPTALRVERVVVRHPVGRGSVVHALSDVSFDVAHDETVGLVGESGCGKSTMARAILQLPPPNAGLVRLGDTVLTELRGDALRRQRPRLQIVFQDPTSSLNPRRRITQIVMEPMDIWRVPRDEAVGRAERALRAVGLEPDTVATRRPHELSGGQRQRVSLARALVLEPEFIVLDEPLSALDVSVQAQILELLADVRQRYRLSLLFISHDLAVVKHISDRVAVMYLGKLCEIGPSEAVYARPTHPYTLDLIRAVPRSDPPDEADRGRASPAGGVDIPSPIDPPSGCRFRTRCARAQAVCATEEPAVLPVGPSQFVACHFPLTGPAPSA